MVSADENGRVGSDFLTRIVLPKRFHGSKFQRHIQTLQILIIPHRLISQNILNTSPNSFQCYKQRRRRR